MCDILLNYEDNHIAMIEHLITSNEVVDYFWNLYQLINKNNSNGVEKKIECHGDYVMTYLETFQSMLNQMVALVVLRSYKKNQS